MAIHCYVAITLASGALALAAYPHAHRLWERGSRRARWHRRVAWVRAIGRQR
jgi:hypothetical protein